MTRTDSKFRAIVSSDWSECLSPNGPFDPISHVHQRLRPELSEIFDAYTGNEITLTEATHRIDVLMPGPLSREQMDDYLDASFQTYKGVPELMQWCLDREILFMINTTGTQGYFQRAIGRALLPELPIVAANPMIRFPVEEAGGRFAHMVLEIEDKPKCTEAVLNSYGLTPDRLAIMGDSGGDGPHFQWGRRSGAYLVSSMAKASLDAYCRSRDIEIDKRFGISYVPGETRDVEREMEIDFMELTDVLSAVLNL
jgi:hypothetical protein